MFAGRATYVRLMAYYEQRNFSHPRLFAAATTGWGVGWVATRGQSTNRKDDWFLVVVLVERFCHALEDLFQ